MQRALAFSRRRPKRQCSQSASLNAYQALATKVNPTGRVAPSLVASAPRVLSEKAIVSLDLLWCC